MKDKVDYEQFSEWRRRFNCTIISETYQTITLCFVKKSVKPFDQECKKDESQRQDNKETGNLQRPNDTVEDEIKQELHKDYGA